MGQRTFKSSTATVYGFLFILLSHQLLIVHSFRLMNNDLDQYQTDHEDARRLAIRRLAFENFPNTDGLSFFNDNNSQSSERPTVQRRFCCMNPLSGRKRSVRDLARDQLSKQQI